MTESVCLPDFAPIDEVIGTLIKEHHMGTAVQLFVEVNGKVVVDLAYGSCIDLAVGVDSLHPLYCLTKPLLAVAVAHLVADGQVSYDSDIRELSQRAESGGREIRISEILSHTAGLGAPTAATWRMTAPREREKLLNVPAAHMSSAQYSEVLGWLLLSEAIEHLTAMPAETFVYERIIDPMALDLVVDPGRANAAKDAGQLRVPVGGLPYRSIPFLTEALPLHLADISATFSGLGSMHSMGMLYLGLGSLLRGNSVPGLPSPDFFADLLNQCRREPTPDSVLRRDASFAGGFMTNADGSSFGPALSRNTIGHSSGIVNAVAFHDPDLGVSAALLMNGSTLDIPDYVRRRNEVLSMIIDHVQTSS